MRTLLPNLPPQGRRVAPQLGQVQARERPRRTDDDFLGGHLIRSRRATRRSVSTVGMRSCIRYRVHAVNSAPARGVGEAQRLAPGAMRRRREAARPICRRPSTNLPAWIARLRAIGSQLRGAIPLREPAPHHVHERPGIADEQRRRSAGSPPGPSPPRSCARPEVAAQDVTDAHWRDVAQHHAVEVVVHPLLVHGGQPSVGLQDLPVVFAERCSVPRMPSAGRSRRDLPAAPGRSRSSSRRRRRSSRSRMPRRSGESRTGP